MAGRTMIVGIDMGTTKVATVIAEVSENGSVSVIGVGHHVAQGMQRGVVINIDKTSKAILKSIEAAEEMAGVEVKTALAGIAGDHIRSINSKGVIPVQRPSRKDRVGVITQQDVDRVIEAAKALNLPMDREVLHVLPQSFTVDGHKNIPDPVGMAGVRLEADVHIITGAVASAQNIVRSVQHAGIDVHDLVLEPLAASYAVLNDEERDLGVCLLDLGGGTSDIAVFHEGVIRHTSVIGIGGQNVTRDLSLGLRLGFDHAEELKIEYGHCYTPHVDATETIEIPGIGGRESRIAKRMEMGEIIEPRMEEIFELAVSQLKKADVWDLLTCGIVLTGGSSQLEGIVPLAERVFKQQVKVGYPGQKLNGLTRMVENPAYATAIGLVIYGLQSETDLETYRGDETSLFTRIFGRMREWLETFF